MLKHKKLILLGACFAASSLPAANIFINEGEHDIGEYSFTSGDTLATRGSATLNITGGEYSVGGLITTGSGDALNVSGGAVVDISNYLWASWNTENTNSIWSFSGSGTRVNLNSAVFGLRMGVDKGAQVAATVSGGAALNVARDVLIGEGESTNASLEINGSSSSLTLGGAVKIANGKNSTGVLKFVNGASFSSNSDINLGLAEGSSASILVDNSSFSLGNKGLSLSTSQPAADSSVVFQNGASGSFGSLVMGGNSSHEASMTVAGNSSVVVSGMSNIGSVEGANAVVNVSGGTLTMGGQLNLGSYNSAGASQNSGTGTINLSSGELRLNGTAYLGAYKSAGVLNQTGGVLNQTDGAAAASQIVIGFGSDGTYQISGGSALVNTINVGGSLLAKGVQSKLILKSNAALSSNNIIVGVSSSNANFEGSNAYLISSSGANLSATNLTVNDSGEIKIKLDSSAYNPSNNTIAGAFQAGTLALYRSANVETGILAIDVSGLGKVDGLSEGDVVRIDLFSLSDKMTYNGVVYDNVTLIADFLGDRISIVGESQYWESITGLDFIEFDASTKTAFVSLTYLIPEPSAYAVVFGAIALAFIAIRRRK